MNGESKIIPFDKLQCKHKARANPDSIFALGHSIFIQGAAERLSRFFALVDDEFFRLSEQAENSALQLYYFNCMRYFRCHRETVQKQYLGGLTEVYESFWHDNPLPRFIGFEQSVGTDANTAMLEGEILEETLAINGMIEKGNSLFRKELYALDRRFMVMLGKPQQKIERNPVSPAVLCWMLSSAVEGMAMDIMVKILVYKLFDKELLTSFGSVYREMNAQLARIGVCPALPRIKSMRHHPTKDDTLSADYSRSLNNEAKKKLGMRCGLGIGSSMGRPKAETIEVRQKFSHAPSIRIRPNSANSKEVSWILYIIREACRVLASERSRLILEQRPNEARRVGVSPENAVNDRYLENVVDRVGMIFSDLLEDPNLSASIKVLLTQLQIPILKLAIFDTTFFDKKNHPARMLINSLARAGMIAEIGRDIENPVYFKIESIIDRVQKTLSHDPGFFSALLEEFATFMALEHRRVALLKDVRNQMICPAVF